MLDLTVIEGGGERRDWDRELAQQHFEHFVIVLLRSLASGDGSYQLTQKFFTFLDHAGQSGVPLGPALDAAVRELHERAFDTEGAEFYETERRAITQAALRVIAESMATDSAARARLSKRAQQLAQDIEAHIVSRESRSRENGWSYLQDLAKRLGKWPIRKK